MKSACRLRISRFLSGLLCLVLVVPVLAAQERKASVIKKVEEYPTHQVLEDLAIAVEVCSSDESAHGYFEVKNPVSRGVLPVLVVIENRARHAIRMDGGAIFLMRTSGSRNPIAPLEFREVVGLLQKKSSSKKIPVPIPIPKSVDSQAGIDPKMNQLRARLFETKIIPPGQGDYGFVFFHRPTPEFLNSVGSVYLPEIRNLETGKTMMFFEIPLPRTLESGSSRTPAGGQKPAGSSWASSSFSAVRWAAGENLRQEPAQAPLPPAESSPVLPKKTEMVMSMLSFVTTRTSAPGDKFYGQIMIPVITDSRIIIPVGAYVVGSVRGAKRAGRIQGNAELALDFHTIIFPNGETRQIQARVRAADGYRSEEVRKSEGTIKSDPEKAKDLEEGARNATLGATLGSIVVGGSSGSWDGAGIGGVSGALAGFGLTLLRRGSDVELQRGTQITLVLEQDVVLEKLRK